ncbi:hypothetical protein [Comamonas terrigena]|uniref:hypothetical protein n=1 Tax=Comamonas terrigena TaxID=32013 RepID=UPI002896D5F6|nr:hypothetical protein [Comamonas terrigena]
MRVYVSPVDYFDDIIGEQGVNIDGWKIKIRKHTLPVFPIDKPPEQIDAATLIAEINYRREDIRYFDASTYPKLLQIINSLIGYRLAFFPEEPVFSMWEKDFEEDGITSNMHPIQVESSVEIISVSIGNGVSGCDFNAIRNLQLKFKKLDAERELNNIKNYLKINSHKYINQLHDEYFRRSWESFGKAMRLGENISYLYDIRDALKTKFRTEEVARQKLVLKKDEWSKFGRIFNNMSIEGGRHLGVNVEPVRPMNDDEISFVIDFAKKMLFAYGDYLIDNGTTDQ